MPVIEIDDIWKKYRLGLVGTGSLVHDLNRWWHVARGRPDPYAKIGPGPSAERVGPSAGDGGQEEAGREPESLGEDEIWALRGVSLAVEQGEILGIIGKNGAGKSTLLKILSRTTAPTHGEIRVKGRIASLLEVGTGFHPELTGRENIFLNGAILGMSKAEIRAKFAEIVEFSGVERYIDTPVKRYSSGMYVRLAFAVAAHLEPEILVVDEVLAVGDAEFQKKCLGKMKDVAGHGRTVLFVSHNMAAIEALCARGVLLESGRVVVDGGAPEAVRRHLRDSAAGVGWSVHRACEDLRVGRVDVSYAPEHGRAAEIRFDLELEASAPVDRLFVDVAVETETGQRILQYVAHSYEKPLRVTGPSAISIRRRTSVPPLLPGAYRATVYCYSPDQGEMVHVSDIPAFEVTASRDQPEVYQANFSALLVPRFSTHCEMRPLAATASAR